ncbi:PAS domain S-box protein, partial [uncultured Methylobacterium sp.]|uniref:PAS domain S-box protein n=1 Tax=uncultured Methylobacterium sp. TaxID=157278 RepID=UPI0035CA34F0
MFRIFGIDPRQGEPNLEGLIERCHPDDRCLVRTAWDEALAKRCDFSFETRVVRPSGDVRTVVVRAAYEADGCEGAFIIVTMDVTDLHRTEVRLIESEERVRLLVEGITDCAICMLDPHGIVTDWHAGGERIYGYRSEEVVGQHVSRLYTDDDQAASLPRAALHAAVADGRSTSEGWRVRKDGGLFWASDLIQPIRDNQGNLIGFAQLSRDTTEQRQAAEAMRISEARYRLLTDNSTDMIAQLDRDGRRIYISPASQDLLGYAPAELIGTRPFDTMHPDDVPTFHAMIASLVSGEVTRAVSINRMRHRDGHWIWIEASLHMLRDAAGRPDGFLASVRDTTGRRRAEEDLRESETRYRILADSLPQMVWIMDNENRDTTYANRQFVSYYGAIGTSFPERMAKHHPDDRAFVERAWSDRSDTGGSGTANIRLQHQDGTFRWHRVMVVPIHRDEAIVGWLGTALDIHDAVTAQEALLKSTDLLRIAQTAAGAGAWDVALGADAIVLSPESAAMHGLDGAGPTTLTAAEWNEIVHPDDSVKVWATVKQAVEAQEVYSAEFRVLLPDGGVRWIHGIGRAYFDAHGHPVRLVGLNFDVDRRKQVEAALIEAGQAAETARREAEKASAAKSDFLAAMSHEIRTPLNSILGYTELLLDAGPDEPLDRSKLSRILGSGRALLTIVNDVLDFSKIEAGRIELEPETFALAGLIADTMSMISGIAMDKPMSLRTDIDPNLPPV